MKGDTTRLHVEAENGRRSWPPSRPHRRGSSGQVNIVGDTEDQRLSEVSVWLDRSVHVRLLAMFAEV